MVPVEKFVHLTDTVIKNFEGGYYHPDMYFVRGIIKDARYKNSGETMFGLDRKAGAALSKYPEWATFWNIIDKAGARSKWSWNFMGGSLAPQLRQLASKIMFPQFLSLANKYLSSAAKAALANDDRLVIHFSYATWNGPGWFERFAKAINEAVKKPEATKESIFNEALSARVNSSNSLIRQHGLKMQALIKKMGNAVATGGAATGGTADTPKKKS